MKYENKEDLLIKLFIDEVLGNYEKQTLLNFSPEMGLEDGLKLLWLNILKYLTASRHAFTLLQCGKSSPLLNELFGKEIKEGDYFAPIHFFLNSRFKKEQLKNFLLIFTT